MTKLDKVKEAYKTDKVAALKIVGRFPRLGKERDVIKLAIDCINNPDFYKQIGRDVEACVAAGIAAMEAKYGLKVQ